MIHRHDLSVPESFLRPSILTIFIILTKSCRVLKGSRQVGEMAYIPSERTSKIIRVDVENSSFDELEPEIWWIKGGPGLQTGETHSGQSGAPL